MKEKIVNIQGPYPLQAEIEEDTHRFRVLACGRRWGKTLSAMREAFNMLVKGYITTKERQRGWVVAPTFPLVREDWLMAEELLKDAIVDKKLTEMKLDFGPIGFLEFKSAEREDEGLRGAGLNACVVDEASRVSRKSWEQGLRPALSDKKGKAYFISTPKGRNWFYDMWLRGKDDVETKSWRYPTNTNPYFPKDEWKVILETTPEMILKQEYLADFLEDEAQVFKNIESCLRGTLELPKEAEYYTIGVDLGKAEDFTVITVINNLDCKVVDIHRQNKTDWSLQKKLIKSVAERYRGLVWIDSTGLGDPIEEDLRKSGVNTKDYKFTNQSKQELVEQLIVGIEQGLIGIPDCRETKFLIDELKAFSYEILPSGRIRYSAPQGLHDDGVVSLGLACMGISNFFYRKRRIEEPKREWGTADDWEKLYKSLDKRSYGNPFATDEWVRTKIISKRFKRLERA